MAAAGEDPEGSAAEDVAPEPVPERPATTGTILAAARVEAGLEIEEIARTTRVPGRHLRALEADSHEGLPALPYAQGFVRAFAKAVGLDSEEMCARFRAETSKQPHMPTPAAMTALDERRLPSSALVAASLVALLVVIGLLSAWGAGAFDADVPVAEGLEQAPEQAVVSSTAPPVLVPEVLPQGTGAGRLAADTLAAAGPVVLTATEKVWARVFDPATNTVVFSGIMEPGQRVEVPASPPGLKLWTGRAGALLVTLAGRSLPPLGGASEVLRDVSLSPADLLAAADARAKAAADATPDITAAPVNAPGQ